jgi:23S rRNA maturation mini-RNase III
MNRVVEEELQATILREKSKRLSEAFKKIAEQGKDYNSVEYAQSAQAEIALSGSSD